MKEPVSLEQYQRAETTIEVVEGRRGLIVHAWITVAVVAVLIFINVVVAPEFPWSAFAAAGMLIGLTFHYFGVRNLSETVSARQDKIEQEASRLSA